MTQTEPSLLDIPQKCLLLLQYNNNNNIMTTAVPTMMNIDLVFYVLADQQRLAPRNSSPKINPYHSFDLECGPSQEIAYCL